MEFRFSPINSDLPEEQQVYQFWVHIEYDVSVGTDSHRLQFLDKASPLFYGER